ncbi:hypothetical protein [Methanofollis ethanolicus]|uniref:hypothetical protein n=1 Tax=Methanofollis ethanolicus TaxID=488124 RepID=UPI0008341F0D|nr:hypothetical protein [Methanofollis ethanolicus]
MKKADVLILFGGIMLAAGLLILGTWQGSEKSWPSILMIIVAGAGFLAAGLFMNQKKNDEPEQDERTEKITSLGFRYSWYCTFAGMLVLAYITPFIPLNPGLNLYIALCWMVATAILFQGYYSLRGDAE